MAVGFETATPREPSKREARIDPTLFRNAEVRTDVHALWRRSYKMFPPSKYSQSFTEDKLAGNPIGKPSSCHLFRICSWTKARRIPNVVTAPKTLAGDRLGARTNNAPSQTLREIHPV